MLTDHCNLECVVQMLFPDSELNYSEQQTKAERLETQQQCLEGLLDCVKEFEETPSEDSELKALILDDWKRLLESRAGQELIVGIRLPRGRDLRQQPVSVAINGQRATGATRPRIEYKKLSLTENLDKSKEWLDNRLRKLKQEVTWADKNIAEFNNDATVLQKPGIRLEFELVRFEEGGAEIPVAQFRGYAMTLLAYQAINRKNWYRSNFTRPSQA